MMHGLCYFRDYPYPQDANGTVTSPRTNPTYVQQNSEATFVFTGTEMYTGPHTLFTVAKLALSLYFKFRVKLDS